VNGTAWAATLARSTIDALFRVDDVVTTTLGGRYCARRALISAGCASGAFFGFDDVGHDIGLGLNFDLGWQRQESTSLA